MQTTTQTVQPQPRGEVKAKRAELKNKLWRNPHRSKGRVCFNVTSSEDELTLINARCKSLGMNRSAYLRLLAYNDCLYNGPLAIHAIRFELLRQTEAGLATLKAESEVQTGAVANIKATAAAIAPAGETPALPEAQAPTDRLLTSAATSLPTSLAAPNSPASAASA